MPRQASSTCGEQSYGAYDRLAALLTDLGRLHIIEAREWAQEATRARQRERGMAAPLDRHLTSQTAKAYNAEADRQARIAQDIFRRAERLRRLLRRRA